MKKLNFFAVLFLGLAISACSNDDDNGGNSRENEMTFDGAEYELKSGMIFNYGSWNDENIYNFDIFLVDSEVSHVNGDYVPENNIFTTIYFELWTDNANDLAIGEYTFSIDESAGTFSSASVVVESNFEEQANGTEHDINDGTIEILENGSGTYEIAFNCLTVGDMEISGYYEGSLYTENHSDRQSNGKQASKKLLLTKKK